MHARHLISIPGDHFSSLARHIHAIAIAAQSRFAVTGSSKGLLKNRQTYLLQGFERHPCEMTKNLIKFGESSYVGTRTITETIGNSGYFGNFGGGAVRHDAPLGRRYSAGSEGRNRDDLRTITGYSTSREAAAVTEFHVPNIYWNPPLRPAARISRLVCIYGVSVMACALVAAGAVIMGDKAPLLGGGFALLGVAGVFVASQVEF